MRYLRAPRPGSYADRFFERPILRALQVTGVAAVGAFSIWAIDAFVSSESDKILPPDPIETEVIVRHSQDGWAVECFGPTSTHQIEAGDSLSRIIEDEVRVLGQLSLGSADTPVQVVAGAIVKMNNLESPDIIIEGEMLILPKECQVAL